MKMLRVLAALSLLVCSPALAQWQTPNHSVPLGRGGGTTGFGSAAPGTTALPFVSNGATSDPSFQLLTNAGMALMQPNTIKCNPTAGLAAVQDCAWPLSGVENAAFFTTASSSPSISSANCGAPMKLQGSAFYSVTIGAASGFPAGCVLVFINNDGRGKKMLANGLPNRILWPRHVIRYRALSNAWVADPGEEPRFAINCADSLLTALCPLIGSGYGINIFTDKLSGSASDSNDCLAADAPCLTISGSKQILYNFIDLGYGGYPIINIGTASAATYTEQVTFQGPPPSGVVTFLVCGSGVTWKPPTGGGVALVDSDAGIVELGLTGAGGGCAFDNTGGASGAFAVEVHQSIIDFNGGNSFGLFTAGTHIFADHNSSVNMNSSYSVTGNVANHLTLGPASTFIQNGSTTVTFTGSPTLTTLYNVSGAGATVSLSPSITFTGSATTSNFCLVAGPSAVILNGNLSSSNCSSGATHNGQIW